MGAGRIIIAGMDRLASRIVNSIHAIFGVQYSRNQEFYIYPIEFAGAVDEAVGTQHAGSIRITQEADFVCARVQVGTRDSDGNIVTSSGAAGDLPDAPFTLELVDGSTDRALQNAPVDAEVAYSPFGGYPGEWPKARLFSRNGNLQVKIQTLKKPPSGKSFNHKVYFIGWKIYDANALDLTTRRA